MDSNSCLPNLPLDTLRSITDWLEIEDATKLALLVGSPTLSFKLCSPGGISSLSYQDSFSDKICLNNFEKALPKLLASTFKGLTKLELICGSAPLNALTPATIRTLPATLTLLAISTANAYSCWLEVPPPKTSEFDIPSSWAPSVESDLNGFKEDYNLGHYYTTPSDRADYERTMREQSNFVSPPSLHSRVVRVRDVLPNLVYLSLHELQERYYRGYGLTDKTREWLDHEREEFLLSLPRGLTSLSLSKWNQWDAADVGALPTQSLTQLSLGMIFTTKMVEESHSRPQDDDDYYSEYDELDYEGNRESGLELGPEPEMELFSSNSPLLDLTCDRLHADAVVFLPPHLTKFRCNTLGSGNYYREQVYSNGVSVFNLLPRSLRHLSIRRSHPFKYEDAKGLPPHLTSLQLSLSEMWTQFGDLPSSLEILNLRGSFDRGSRDYPKLECATLPASLHTLSFSCNGVTMVDKDIASLPTGLTSLSLHQCGSALMGTVFGVLPRSLTALCITPSSSISLQDVIIADQHAKMVPPGSRACPPTLHRLQLADGNTRESTGLSKTSGTPMTESKLCNVPLRFTQFCVRFSSDGSLLPSTLVRLHPSMLAPLIEKSLAKERMNLFLAQHPSSNKRPKAEATYSSVLSLASRRELFGSDEDALEWGDRSPSRVFVLPSSSKIPKNVQVIHWEHSDVGTVLRACSTCTNLTSITVSTLDVSQIEMLPVTLTKLSFAPYGTSSLVVPAIARLKNLKNLKMRGFEVMRNVKTGLLPVSLESFTASFAHSIALRGCTRLLSLRLTSNDIYDGDIGELPASLQTLILTVAGEAWATTNRLTPLHLANLPKGLTHYSCQSLKLHTKDISTLPPNLTYLKLSSLQLADSSLIPAIQAVPKELVSLTMPKETLLLCLVKSLRPLLKFEFAESTRLSYDKYDATIPSTIITDEFYKCLPAHLTALNLAEWHLPKELGVITQEQLRFLPPGLTFLDIRRMPNVLRTGRAKTPSAFTPEAVSLLPASLTDLRLPASKCTPEALLQLPRGLRTLYLDPIGKWSPEHARALPPELVNLRITCEKLEDPHIDYFPPSLTTLALLSANLTKAIVPFLPSKLAAFYCSSPKLQKNQMPPSIKFLFVADPFYVSDGEAIF